MEDNLYIAVCMCGHVGRSFFIVKSFPIQTDNAKHAAEIARTLPRVKSNHKYAVLSVTKVDQVDFEEALKAQDEDPYQNCHCVQDQRRYADSVYLERIPLVKEEEKHHSKEKVKYQKRKEKQIRKCDKKYEEDSLLYENWLDD